MSIEIDFLYYSAICSFAISVNSNRPWLN